MNSLIERWKTTVDSQKRRRLDAIEEGPALHEQSYDLNEVDSDYVRGQAQKVVDVLIDYDKNPPPMAKFSRVCRVIEETIERARKDRGLQPEASQLKELRESTRVRAEKSSRAMTELEDKLFAAERDKLQLRSEKDDLQRRVELQQREISQLEMSRELIQTLQDAHRILERSNTALLADVDQLRQYQAEREATWQLELEQLQTVISQLAP
jgi:predicted RNase H-like nuclease (RuvC/YqgF family)